MIYLLEDFALEVVVDIEVGFYKYYNVSILHVTYIYQCILLCLFVCLLTNSQQCMLQTMTWMTLICSLCDISQKGWTLCAEIRNSPEKNYRSCTEGSNRYKYYISYFLLTCGHVYLLCNLFSAGTDFRRQNLVSRRHIMSISAPKELYFYNGCRPIT